MQVQDEPDRAAREEEERKRRFGLAVGGIVLLCCLVGVIIGLTRSADNGHDAPAAGSAPAPTYSLQKSYVGEDFFSEANWNFFTEPDPCTGMVEYVSKDTAEKLDLVNANYDNGKVYIGADLTNVMNKTAEGGRYYEGRKSIRIETTTIFQQDTGGLFIVDLEHMPSGCGVWPAWWLLGMDADHPWPVWGEMDIIEGAHGQDRVQTVLHTKGQCDQSSNKEGVDFTGAWKENSKNCMEGAPGQDANAGCGVLGAEHSMSALFNKNGGGTFAMEWAPKEGHISAWFFKEGSAPNDIKAKKPKPESWGKPYAHFTIGTETCALERFQQQRMIFNTDFCGQYSSGYAGGPEEVFHASPACSEVPESMTCPEYVAKNPDKLREAYWVIRSLDTYQNHEKSRAELVI